jgi:hypothetical protein
MIIIFRFILFFRIFLFFILLHLFLQNILIIFYDVNQFHLIPLYDQLNLNGVHRFTILALFFENLISM